MSSAFEPVQVAVLDVDAPKGIVDPWHLAGGHSKLWLVLRAGGRPRRLVELDRRETTTPARLEAAVTLVRDETGPNPVRPGRQPASSPAISVVIPTVGQRLTELQRCLEALAAQSYPRFEVVVVDNRPAVPADDVLARLVAEHPLVRTVHEPVPGISAARNAGVAAATGEIVAFTDDDVMVAPGWLDAIGARFALLGEDAVTGLVLPGELVTAPQLMFERYYGGFSGVRTFAPISYGRRRSGWLPELSPMIDGLGDDGGTVATLTLLQAGACGAGCNMAFRRTVLLDHPFEVALGTGTPARGGEDLAALIGVLWRGGRIGYEPAAVVSHFHRRDYPSLLHQMTGYGTGFTAALASLPFTDPRYLLAFARLVPWAVRRFAAVAAARLGGRAVYDSDAAGSPGTGPGTSPGTSPDSEELFPPELARRELAGYLRGPVAYLRARRVPT